ncbi:hypothetical protein BCR44DRAFT_1423177 [Catenaria anguillulae PL171]|uniref:Uncharacterized protein n=1 Tax=Catenaria anguillulae PL171 TaxID=765915 RepID=A0A1Y2I6C2_9FUNG|nr:hypothetical protein BCR44DRAFT_1423177 [Catenaria anguillulae PL171]
MFHQHQQHSRSLPRRLAQVQEPESESYFSQLPMPDPPSPGAATVPLPLPLPVTPNAHLQPLPWSRPSPSAVVMQSTVDPVPAGPVALVTSGRAPPRRAMSLHSPHGRPTLSTSLPRHFGHGHSPLSAFSSSASPPPSTVPTDLASAVRLLHQLSAGIQSLPLSKPPTGISTSVLVQSPPSSVGNGVGHVPPSSSVEPSIFSSLTFSPPTSAPRRKRRVVDELESPTSTRATSPSRIPVSHQHPTQLSPILGSDGDDDTASVSLVTTSSAKLLDSPESVPHHLTSTSSPTSTLILPPACRSPSPLPDSAITNLPTTGTQPDDGNASDVEDMYDEWDPNDLDEGFDRSSSPPSAPPGPPQTSLQRSRFPPPKRSFTAPIPPRGSSLHFGQASSSPCTPPKPPLPVHADSGHHSPSTSLDALPSATNQPMQKRRVHFPPTPHLVSLMIPVALPADYDRTPTTTDRMLFQDTVYLLELRSLMRRQHALAHARGHPSPATGGTDHGVCGCGRLDLDADTELDTEAADTLDEEDADATEVDDEDHAGGAYAAYRSGKAETMAAFKPRVWRRPPVVAAPGMRSRSPGLMVSVKVMVPSLDELEEMEMRDAAARPLVNVFCGTAAAAAAQAAKASTAVAAESGSRKFADDDVVWW